MISFEDVSFSYPGQEMGKIKDFNLTIKDGECVLLCGKSGCGKTTLTKLVNGLIPYFYIGEFKGNVTVNGMLIGDTPMYKIAEKIGSVFQNPRTQFFNVDTDSEIAFGIENEALPPEELRRRVDQTISDLQIKKLCGRNIFELSGGEKQKIAFASVYTMNPDVYLLDEPSSNLDMASIGELKKHLRLIKAQGKTIIITEHRLYYLMELADRIIYLREGQIGGIYTPDGIQGLSGGKRKEMGLRAVDLFKVHPTLHNENRSVSVMELRNVTLKYNKRIIVENINFRASRGEIISIVGNNGSGKSTFSRALCGLHKGSAGQFLWEGKVQDPKQRLHRSYMVMQDVNYQLFAESVEAECSFGMKNHDRNLVHATMEELGLTSYKDQHPNTLSGGQKQRTAIAVSLICGKEILVFDEPTSGLDYDSMVQVAGLMRKLADMGKIVFVVTHDYEFVCRIGTRVLYFDKGEISDDIMVSIENKERLMELFCVQESFLSRRDDEGEGEKSKSYITPAYMGR